MEILWQPEPGKCHHCGRKFKLVRRFTTERHHVIFCYSCWQKAQEGKQELFVNRKEWKDDTAMKFELFDDDVNEEHGATQSACWN